MAEEEKTPVQIANERLADLEQKSQGFLAGLTDKVAGTFWDKVKEFFVVLFSMQGADTLNTFQELYKFMSFNILESGQVLLKEDTHAVIENILEEEVDPDKVLRSMELATKTVPYLGWLYNAGQWALTLVGMTTANLAATMELATQRVLEAQRPSLLALDATIEAYYKDPTLKAEIKDILNRMGLSDQFQEMLWIATETPLDELSTKDAYLRNIIDETEHDSTLKAHHIPDIDIKVLKQLYELIPPVNDIITMAVREAFTPEIVERFGQMSDLPPDFVKWASQKGLTEYWTKAYWAAHWALPSILQGFEMLHRRVIGESDLDLLLRALDVMPFWRDKLTAISYNPLTRVDVRRMFGLGVLKEEGVFNAYLDVGYNETNAKLMTEFTIAFVSEKEKDLTKADIIALYKKYAIPREEAFGMLQNLGYVEANAELLMARADLEIYATYKKEQIGYIKSAYVSGKINEGEALSRLGKLDMPATEVNRLMESWDLARVSKVKDLTLENLKAFFKGKVISIEELTDELRELGYSEQDTGRFVALFQKGD